jgi:hypothetical protein
MPTSKKCLGWLASSFHRLASPPAWHGGGGRLAAAAAVVRLLGSPTRASKQGSETEQNQKRGSVLVLTPPGTRQPQPPSSSEPTEALPAPVPASRAAVPPALPLIPPVVPELPPVPVVPELPSSAPAVPPVPVVPALRSVVPEAETSDRSPIQCQSPGARVVQLLTTMHAPLLQRIERASNERHESCFDHGSMPAQAGPGGAEPFSRFCRLARRRSTAS